MKRNRKPRSEKQQWQFTRKYMIAGQLATVRGILERTIRQRVLLPEERELVRQLYDDISNILVIYAGNHEKSKKILGLE